MENNESDIFTYLATNKDFRDWVLCPNDERNYYWNKWMKENPEAVGEVIKAREFIERMNFKQEQLSYEELDEMLEKIIADEKPAFKPKLPPSSMYKRNFYTIDQWIKVAAILVICFTAAIVINRHVSQNQVESAPVVVEWKTIENPRGIKSKVILPDSTVIMLNAGSALKYPQYFSDSLRLVELKGEAFFEVMRDEQRPFIIQTERMTTEVLGTSFNINAYAHNENESIAVVSGVVKVSNSKGEAEILIPNEMGLISKDNNINKTPFDVNQITGWKDGIISFKRATFHEIQEKLSLWYGVDFVTSRGFSMDNVYTGEYVNEKLENVMEGIAYSSGFKYKIEDNKIFIYK